MPTLRLFAQAKEAAGTRVTAIQGTSVAEVLATAVERFGEPFAQVLGTSAVWLNGEPAEPTDAVREADEVAVLPPVSGGAA